MRNDTYQMLDPTAELSPVIRERLAPPADLSNATVGLLCISKERSEEFLDSVEAALSQRGIRVARFAKPTHTKPAPEEVVQAIVERCDVVVEGLAATAAPAAFPCRALSCSLSSSSSWSSSIAAIAASAAFALPPAFMAANAAIAPPGLAGEVCLAGAASA